MLVVTVVHVIVGLFEVGHDGWQVPFLRCFKDTGLRRTVEVYVLGFLANVDVVLHHCLVF